MSQRHDEGVPLPPRKATVRKVHLALLAWWRLEAHQRLGRRPEALHEFAELREAAGVASRSTFAEEARPAQPWVLGEPCLDNRLKGVELVGTGGRPR